MYTFFLEFPDAAAARRGLGYAEGGNVVFIKIRGNGTILSQVIGTRARPYEVEISDGSEFALNHMSAMCSCPVELDCKHAYAAGLRVLGALYKRSPNWVPWAAEYLPDRWLGADAVLPAAQIEGTLPWRTLEKSQARAPGNAPWWRQVLEAAEGDMVDQLLAREIKNRTDAISQYFLQRTIRELRQRPMGRVAILRSFEDALRRLASLGFVRLRPDRSGLAAWLLSEECARVAEEESRDVGIHLMEHWLQEVVPDAGVPQDQVEIEWRVAPGSGDGGLPVLQFQVLLTSATLRRKPRHGTGLAQLIRDVARGNRNVPELQARVLGWLGSQVDLHYGLNHEEEFPVENAMGWLAQWAHRGAFTWADSRAPVIFDVRPAALRLVRQDAAIVWAVRLEEDSEPVPLDQLTLVTDSDEIDHFTGEKAEVFVRYENTLRRLETGGVPVPLLGCVNKNAELPLDALRSRGLGQNLLMHLERIGGVTEAWMLDEIPVQTQVQFHLTGKFQIHLRAVAHGPESLHFVRESEGDWRTTREEALPENAFSLSSDTATDDEAPHENEEAADSAAIAYRPRAADLAPVDAWLEQLVPPGAVTARMPAGQPSASWMLDADALEAFLDAWEQRPPGTACYGNRALRDLVLLRTPPRFQVDVKASGVQWLSVSVAMQAEADALRYEDVEAALSTQDTPSILLPKGGRYRRGDLEAYQAQMRTFAELGIAPETGEHRVHALQLGSVSYEALPESSAAVKRLVAKAAALRERFKGLPAVKLSRDLDATLRPYQRAGVEFCAWACATFGGAILADDMGLGKTLQVLALMTVLRKKKNGKKPALVICPASVTHNWQREAERFTPKLRTLVLESGAGRKEHLERAEDYDLIITNYSLARRDIDLLKETAWGLICVDEAQAIKNPDAAITRALKSLDASYRIALTGTPIENRLMDLWSITDFAVPGYLANRSAYEGSAKSPGDALDYKRLRARLRPILLRRMKGEVAPELPPRIEERLDCTMTSAQRRAYLAELKRAQQLLNSTGKEKVAGQSRIQILAALTRLRQLCCDPALRGMPKAGSGKSEVFLGQLQDIIDSGHKVLVFSQFVTMLDLLNIKLTERGIPFYTLTGKTRKRTELVAAFEADSTPSAFLISLKAGGSGLNLVSASHVILFDPWWNPAVEAQAIDRTHRIGQDKTVVAYRLVTEDSIEERILELQEKKRSMVANVLEADAFNRSLTREDFSFILR